MPCNCLPATCREEEWWYILLYTAESAVTLVYVICVLATKPEALQVLLEDQSQEQQEFSR